MSLIEEGRRTVLLFLLQSGSDIIDDTMALLDG
jgi:hypothetical protein